MKHTITVKKNKNQRNGIRFLTAMSLIAAILMLLVLSPKQDLGLMLLICLFCMLPFFILLFYFESWQIVFFSDKICKKLFFLTIKTYPYHMIREVVQTHLYSMRSDVIIIKFVQGKKIRFCVNDEYADKAKKRLGTIRMQK